ncbi:MAG: hypothetical protein ACP5UF_05745 [Hydrogenobaculum sp.]
MNRKVEITILNIKGSELTTLAQYENPNNKWEQIEIGVSFQKIKIPITNLSKFLVFSYIIFVC